ncbi:hypothetical protein PV383_38525 [Streptomyces caniscabiei]|uniref:Uncharacterized protein n=1 Tax=Streptomyces caniscabiei TaxID=2746961 RepID=A0ABU4N1S6_9ACTN|nr:hypothetical protein [Streptomyces caniscabiei]MDX2946830.1 hypothetical protein [Streptomyces caniscabiei]MDX3043034.1 hypothetical protein [Streptomyces caniscabiei]
MSRQQSIQELPVTLGLPLEDPVPPADCGVCAALVVQRSEARARDDRSRASDLNIEIRNHHQPRQKRRR